mgnify:CR=1 FL=1
MVTDNKGIIKKISGNEFAGIRIIEVTKIPSISILDDIDYLTTSHEEIMKTHFSSMLYEVHQINNDFRRNEDPEIDISLELLWLSEAVEGQTYHSRVRMFMISRVISKSQKTLNRALSQISKSIISGLNIQKFEYELADYSGFEDLYRSYTVNAAKAVVKEERIEHLQNQMFPVAFSYDKIPQMDQNLSRIVNSMINYPNVALSFQLIPTNYTDSEKKYLDYTLQSLNTLSNGVMEHGMGHISFALAGKHTELYRYYSENKHSALFSYNIVVYGTEEGTENLTNQVYGFLTNSKTESVHLKTIDLSKQELSNDMLLVHPWKLHDVLVDIERNSQVVSGQFQNCAYLPYIITAAEAVEFFRLPQGNDSISAGFVVNESLKKSRTYTDNIINAGDLEFGRLKASGSDDILGIGLQDLAKHMLVVGTPGSGKSTFSVSVLDKLWKKHKIPFLVIEPAKNEYRALIQSIPDLQVFTPGKNFISPFVFNPFVPPKNVKLETYKSTLKTAFAAGVSMTSPLDKIFEESINNCYSEFRWFDSYTSDDAGSTFNISDFIKVFRETFDEIGYTGDAKNIGRAGEVRLKSLVNLFDNYHSIPIEDLLTKPTVIELAAIENSDEKALIISLLLLSILSYVNSNYLGDGNLKNVILLEEAHVLLDSHGAGQGDAQPSIIAQGLIKRMLAEIRSYGVGLMIADQSPRKVTTDVVALTDCKVAFRLVEGEDKNILSNSINMTDVQKERLGKLKPGEAFVFYNKLEEPEEVVTENYRLNNEIDISLTDDGIKSLTKYWDDKGEKLRPYPQCETVKWCQSECDLEMRMMGREISKRVFRKYIKNDCSDMEKLKETLKNLPNYVQDELNNEEYSEKLKSCTKAHLWRYVIYNTKLKVKDVAIEKSLSR